MEEDVLNALQMRCAYLCGGYDRSKRIIFIVNAFNDLQLWNRRCLQLTLEYLKRSLSAAVLQNGVCIIVNAQERSTRISRQHVRQIYALFGGDISVDLYLVRAEGFWEKHVEPCAKSQTKGEASLLMSKLRSQLTRSLFILQPLVLSKARLSKFIEPAQLPEELGGSLQFNYDLWLQQRKSIDEFSKTHALTLSAMDQLLVLLGKHKSLRPTEADVELKSCAQLHTHVQRCIEAAIEMGNAILARFNEVYETQTPQAAPVAASSATATTTTTIAATSASRASSPCPVKPLLPPDLGCERARIELRLNEIEKKQTAIRTAWLELLRSLREARELSTLAEGVAFVTNWILNQAEQLLSRQRSVGADIRASETLRAAHDQLELECRETYGCYAELLYKIERFAKERDQLAIRDLLSQRDFMQFVCRAFAVRLERRRKVLMTSLRFHRLLDQFEEQLSIASEASEAEPCELNWAQSEQLLAQLKSSQQMLGNIERELVREGEKLSDMLAMPVKDALGRDLQLDYSADIGQLRRQIEASRERRQLCGERVALQRLTLEQVTHIYGYEQEVRSALQWLNELYAVLLRCHSHVGCNIHEIQLQKDELQGFEETGRSIYNYGCQLLEAAQTLRLCCKLPAQSADMLLQLQRTWHSLQSIAQEQMTRLRVSAVFHRSVEAYYRQLRELRPLLTHELATHELATQHNRSSSGISSDADISPELSPNNELSARLQRHLLAREQLLVEVGRMVRLGRLLKKRLKESFVLDALTGKRFRNIFAKTKAEEEPQLTVPSIVVEEVSSEQLANENENERESESVKAAPLASEEEDLGLADISSSTQELSKLLDELNVNSQLPEQLSSDEQATGEEDCEDDDTASTSSVKTKIAKASMERDVLEETEEEASTEQLHSLDKIKALIRNDSETYPQSDYTDTDEPTPPLHSRTASQDSSTDLPLLTQLPNSFSVQADELPLDGSPTALIDSGRNSSASNSTLNHMEAAASPSTVVVTPTGSNELACAAITHKLGAIAELAESLDAAIRDSTSVQAEKKLGSNGFGSEDWQSRSTEDESFATASEGNFTPNSHSSSFQTAGSGRTSSYIGSAKNSFDEADDSTLSNFEIPELPQSPINMSFDSSELSYFSAQQPLKSDDQNSEVGVPELHSQSVTPTPDEAKTDSELEGFALDAALISNESLPRCSNAVTPEVSGAQKATAAEQTSAAAAAATATALPPHAAWRRSKYYENITKQTIKGFL
ncbi:CG15822 [Drosophila busckii]|uniref:CG15822 n=1 Tax=Drosophila busckii TaxID=30019 RepID=A0A0M4EGW9_DROBS|nr:CG15822 [Drosophila busckii]